MKSLKVLVLWVLQLVKKRIGLVVKECSCMTKFVNILQLF